MEQSNNRSGDISCVCLHCFDGNIFKTRMIRVKYLYSSHYDTTCERNGYLGFRTNRKIQSSDQDSKRFQHPRDMYTASPRDFQHEVEKQTKGAAAAWEKKHENWIDLPITTTTPSSLFAIEELVFVVYQYVQTTTTSSDDFEMLKPAERRLDECLMYLGKLLESKPPVTNKRWLVCSGAAGQFSIAIDTNASYMTQAPGGVNRTKVPKKRLVLAKLVKMHKNSAETWQSFCKRRTQAVRHLSGVTSISNQFYYQEKGLFSKWPSKKTRDYQNSYVDLPSEAKLPGIFFLRLNSIFGSDAIPEGFFAHHCTLALSRLPRIANDVQLALEELAETKDAEKALAAWSSGVVRNVGRWVCDVVAWPVRASTAYMLDGIDGCKRRRGAPQNAELDKSTLTAAPEKKFDAELVSDKKKQHIFKPTDQFTNVFGSAFQTRLADDCETVMISCFIVFMQMMQCRATSPMVQAAKAFASLFYPVMVTCSIVPGSSSEGLICHVILVLIPKRRLDFWLKRGHCILRDGNARGLVDEQDPDAHLPCLLVDSTEYTACLQLETDLLDTGYDNDKTFAFVLDMRNTFKKCGMFITKNPDRLVSGYNLYKNVTSGLCLETKNVPEFAFMNIKDLTMTVDFRDLMDLGATHKIACVPTQSPDKIAKDKSATDAAFDIVTDPEPWTPIPRWDPSQETKETTKRETADSIFYEMYARDIDWELNRQAFEKWFLERHPTMRFTARRVIVFGDCFHWIVRVRGNYVSP